MDKLFMIRMLLALYGGSCIGVSFIDLAKKTDEWHWKLATGVVFVVIAVFLL